MTGTLTPSERTQARTVLSQALFGAQSGAVTYVVIDDYEEELRHICKTQPGVKMLKSQPYPIVLQHPKNGPRQELVSASVCSHCGTIFIPEW